MVSSAGTLENRPVNRINFDHHTWLSRVERDASEEIDEKAIFHQDGLLEEPATSRASPGKDGFRERSKVHPPSVSWQFV